MPLSPHTPLVSVSVYITFLHKDFANGTLLLGIIRDKARLPVWDCATVLSGLSKRNHWCPVSPQKEKSYTFIYYYCVLLTYTLGCTWRSDSGLMESFLSFPSWENSQLGIMQGKPSLPAEPPLTICWANLLSQTCWPSLTHKSSNFRK